MNDLIPVQKQKFDRAGDIDFGNRRLADNSKLVYRQAINNFLHHIAGKGITLELVKNWIQNLTEQREEGTIKPATYNLRLQVVKDWLISEYKHDLPSRYAIEQLFKGFKRPVVERAIHNNEYLTHDQLEDLTGKTTERIALILWALFWTGCRVSELIRIKLADVKTNGKVTIKVLGKGGKERTVYMPLKLYDNCRQIFVGKICLFETKNGTLYNRVALYKEIKRQSEKHGYFIHPHTLRHSLAMYLKDERNLTPDQTSKYLGHADVSTTLKFYYHGIPNSEDIGIFD
ncbi:MAG: site-specific integrase [Nitrospirae bacterium]|nr:site-specific integrase [Nitrospirota bacterium]